MHHLAAQVFKPPGSLRFILTLRRLHPTARFLSSAKSLALCNGYIPFFHDSSSSRRPIQSRSFTAGCRDPNPMSTALESDEPHSPEPPAAVPVEDFVHVDNSEVQEPEPEPEPEPDPNPNPNFDAVAEASAEEKRELPEELMRSVVVLTCESSAEGGSCDVYLVGTAHVSQDSCREVEAVISSLKPQVVFLELCSSRIAVLKPQNLKVPTMSEMIDMWKKKNNVFGIMYSWFLAKVANKLEVFPGSEFRVAFEEAMKYGGKVILGDRPVNITLRRTWIKMPFWHKAKLLYSLLFQAVFLPSADTLNKMLKEMDDVDMLTLVIQEMSKEFPTLMETLVHERDQYMSATLLKVASEYNSVVAVVGKGHLQGIKKNWKQPIMTKDLLEIPSPKPAFHGAKILKSVGVAVAGVAIVSGIYLASKK